jgi:transcriptional regulator with XRE-family HTH domain
MDKYGKAVRELRDKNGDTREELAKKLKISESALGKYERGERTIKPELLERIAGIYEVPASYFFGDQQKFTEAEQEIIQESDLSLELLKEKYNLVIDGKPATNEEIEEMIKHIKLYRLMKQMESS